MEEIFVLTPFREHKSVLLVLWQESLFLRVQVKFSGPVLWKPNEDRNTHANQAEATFRKCRLISEALRYKWNASWDAACVHTDGGLYRSGLCAPLRPFTKNTRAQAAVFLVNALPISERTPWLMPFLLFWWKCARRQRDAAGNWKNTVKRKRSFKRSRPGLVSVQSLPPISTKYRWKHVYLVQSEDKTADSCCAVFPLSCLLLGVVASC